MTTTLIICEDIDGLDPLGQFETMRADLERAEFRL